MKKILSLILLSSFATFQIGLAQTPTEPVQIASNFSVVNVSQENKDATGTPANVGDVLRYELILDGYSAVEDLGVRIDASQLTNVAEMVDLGGGSQEGTTIVFPNVDDLNQTWNRQYQFFARLLPEAANLGQVTVVFADQSLTVAINSGAPAMISAPVTQVQPDLSATGPSKMIVLGLVMFGLFWAGLAAWRRKA